MKHRKVLSMLLALAMAAALTVPAFAARVNTTYYETNYPGGGDAVLERWTTPVDLDQEPIAVCLPWSAEGYLSVVTVPVGTSVQKIYAATGEYNPDEELREAWGAMLSSFTRPDGTVLGGNEAAELFGGTAMAEYGSEVFVDFPFTATQAGTYRFASPIVSYPPVLHAINPGDPYAVTVLAQPNGAEAKINAERVVAQGTVSYQGKDIPLYTVLSGTSDESNLYIKQAAGASYVVNGYTAKISNGALTDIEPGNTYEFTGEEGYWQRFWVSGDEVSLFEITENGTVIQTVALLPTDATQSAPAGEVTYTVQRGDTLSNITTNFYGNNAQRYALYNANLEAFRKTNGRLVAGMVLVIPAKLGNATRLPSPVAGEGETLYTIRYGDTLGKIALQYYGSVAMYKAIYERNADRLVNANLIYEGQVIVLPAK